MASGSQVREVSLAVCSHVESKSRNMVTFNGDASAYYNYKVRW